MDKRDRLRTWGGLIRSIIALIPVVLILWSAWYFYAHGAEFMKMISDQAAKSAAEFTKNQGNSLYDQIMKQYKTPQQ